MHIIGDLLKRRTRFGVFVVLRIAEADSERFACVGFGQRSHGIAGAEF